MLSNMLSYAPSPLRGEGNKARLTGRAGVRGFYKMLIPRTR